MRILVFQHEVVEHPGIFRRFLQEDGIPWDPVELDAGESIPPLDGYDALWAMGGPMDVWEEDRYPWLIDEKRAIREAIVERRMPFLGVCLGHQLLGDALGGKVGKMPLPEVGILEVQLTEAGKRDTLFAGIASPSRCLQWHGSAVMEPPPGAEVLAGSPACACQAMRWGKRAYGIQYHVEITGQTIPEWAAIPAYATALDQTLGLGAATRFEGEASACLPEFNQAARTLYRNFLSLAA